MNPTHRGSITGGGSSSIDLDALVEAVGGFIDGGDERLNLPLHEQVALLMKWACSPHPANFRRCVPVEATDHDVLITHTLGRLVAALKEAHDA